MVIKLGVVLVLMGLAGAARGGVNPEEQHVEVVMRMIGHQVLENSGDPISRILPVTHEMNRYRIGFGSEFQLNADVLVSTVDRVIEITALSKHYLVEVEACGTKEIVYSFEVNKNSPEDLVPCQTREQSYGCYTILLTLMDRPVEVPVETPVTTEKTQSGSLAMWWLALPAGIIIALMLVRRFRRGSSKTPGIVRIGSYRFNKRQMELSIKDEKVELTGKEADLLLLLYEAVNTTVERDIILKSVWGDEGDYVGRTLDVFISRLRKKLEGDPAVRILNIRGVGYRLVLNDAG